jgi:hypothetical protein
VSTCRGAIRGLCPDRRDDDDDEELEDAIMTSCFGMFALLSCCRLLFAAASWLDKLCLTLARVSLIRSGGDVIMA